MFGQASESFFDMCKELGNEKSHLNYIAIKISTIIIHTYGEAKDRACRAKHDQTFSKLNFSVSIFN